MRYLEAFGKSCEDISIMFEQQLIMAKNPSLMGKFAISARADRIVRPSMDGEEARNGRGV